MVANVAAMIVFGISAVLAIVSYFFLVKRVSQNRLSALNAGLLLWAVLALTPTIMTWVTFRAGFYLYVAYPSLQHRTWDVGLALVLWLTMMSCYVLGFIGGCLATWRFIVLDSKYP